MSMFTAACGGSDAGTASDAEPVSDQASASVEASDSDADSDSDSDSGSDSADTDSATDTDSAADEAAPTAVPEQLTSEGEGEQGEEPTADPRPGGNFTYGIASDGTGFNTIQPLNEGAFRIIGALNDPLISVDQDGNWTPFLAEAMAPNADFTEWVMTLRSDVRFHDGVTVDAEAVKANVDAFRGSFNVASALAPVAEVNVTGPLEVTFVMNQPWAAFPYTMFGQPGYMVSPSTIGQNDTFVGTGAFVLDSWSPADSAVAIRNDDYWRADLPLLDSVTWKVIPEQSARRAALEAGDVDGINGPGESDILDFLEDDSIDVHIGESSSNEGLMILNTTTAPTDDLRIRQAMAHAIDQQLIIDTYRAGLTIPAKSFVSPNSPWYVETDYPAFDPETAAALVAEYEAEVGPAEITILGRNSTATIEVAELIEALFESVGIDTTIEPIAPGTEVLPVVQDSFQAIMWAQFSALDPDGQYVFFHSNGGLLNWSNLNSEKMNEGFDIGRENADFETRFEGYAMVQEALAEELPMLWFDHWGGIEAVAVTPEVNGIPEVTLLDGTFVENGLVAGSYFSFEDIWVEDQG